MGKWETVRLGDVSTVNPPKKHLLALYENKVISFIPMSNVSEDGGINTNNEKSYSEVSSGFTYFQEDDVLFAKITPCMENGKGAIARGLINGLGVGSTEFHVLRPNKELATSDWIFRFVSFSKFRKLAEKNMTGSAGQKRVPKAFLENVLIPLPPLETQKQIASTLDTAAELLAMRKQQLAELDNLIKSTFYDMFGDPATNPLGWDKKRLGDECEIITGNTPPRKDVNNYGSFIEWIKSDNINIDGMYLSKATEYLSEKGFSACRYVDTPSVLMTCIAGSIKCIGNVGINDRRVSFNQQINAVVPNKNNLFFLYSLFLFTKGYIQSTINMSLKGILSKGKLSELEFIFPPLSLQTQFASIVTKIEEQKALVKKAIDETQYLFDCLMAEYFE